MTRVCLLGDSEVTLRYELLSRETSREALASYDLERPYENSLALRTVSVGAAVSLLNDLQWYLVRFVEEPLVREPSISETEWLSRDLATEIRNERIDPAETGEFLKVYGVESTAPEEPPSGADPSLSGETRPHNNTDRDTPHGVTDDGSDTDDGAGMAPGPDRPQKRLVEPLYVTRADGSIPEYDLRDVDETLVVRLTEAEFAP